MIKKSKVAITIDTDWVSDEVIEYTLALLLKYNAKATWFITHDSNAIKRLFDCNDMFEIGIHPNFLSNSTQGSTVSEVMSNLLSIHPEAKIMRTHSLYQSSLMFETILKKYPGIKADVSLFLPYEEHVRPHRYYAMSANKMNYITRIPYVWEDDYEMYLPKPNFKFDIGRFSGTGIKIFDFHPIHIALNSVTIDSYARLKSSSASGIPKLKLKDVFRFRQTKCAGVEDFLKGLLCDKKAQFVNIKEKTRI